MARVLVVGCGCRGAELAVALLERGYAVRGTSRRGERLSAIESLGAEAVLADPDRLATLLPHLEGVSALCWLMGNATGAPDAVAALHGERLRSLAESLVDTHVRGLVYEAAGSVHPDALERGAEIARAAGAAHRMPVAVVETDPADQARWLSDAARAVDELFAA
jgi:nucleoside-diphosphate-sugar epimerase